MDTNLNIDFNQKADFFKDGYFIINLSAFEVEEKILIPGHRFLPFLNPIVMPWDIKITTQKGIALRQVTKEAPLEILKPRYSLFGDENFLFLLIDDKEDNSEIILEKENHSSQNFYFTAYDLAPLFGSEDKKDIFSDFVVVLKIDDWKKGIYTAYVKTDDKIHSNTGEWITRLEKGFKTVLGNKKKLLILPEVMSDAFVFGGKVLLENPPLSLEDFFDLSEVSSIADTIADSKEDFALLEKKSYIREKTLAIIKKFTSWLETNNEYKKINPEAAIILEKQILMSKKTLIAVLEEINNPFLTEDVINTILQIITESENLVTRIK